jgi:hypothetical protein
MAALPTWFSGFSVSVRSIHVHLVPSPLTSSSLLPQGPCRCCSLSWHHAFPLLPYLASSCSFFSLNLKVKSLHQESLPLLPDQAPWEEPHTHPASPPYSINLLSDLSLYPCPVLQPLRGIVQQPRLYHSAVWPQRLAPCPTQSSNSISACR